MAKFTSIEKLLEEAYQSIVGSPPEHGRVELGTKTLDNRDYWENINFNKDTFQPYLTGNLETLNTELRDGIVYRRNIETSELFQYSIDALPFVTDINDDDDLSLKYILKFTDNGRARPEFEEIERKFTNDRIVQFAIADILRIASNQKRDLERIRQAQRILMNMQYGDAAAEELLRAINHCRKG